MKVSLSNFTIPGVLPVPMTIDATCDVVPSTNELKLNGQTTIDMSALGMGELAVVITGDADGKELDLDIAVADNYGFPVYMILFFCAKRIE